MDILAPNMLPPKSMPTQRGLTLIEVLIALAIIAIALTAIIKAVGENIRGTSYLEDKTAALYVAQQVANEARVGILPLQAQTITEKTNMLGREWYWQAEMHATGNANIHKISVSVYKNEPENDESPIINLEAYRYTAGTHKKK